MNVYTISDYDCYGPNPVCRKAWKEERSIHARPGVGIVWPTYHFASEADVQRMAARDIHTVTSDDELYEARRDGFVYRLPEGWKDPSQRLSAEDIFNGYRVTVELFTNDRLEWSCTCGHRWAGNPDDLPDPAFDPWPGRTVTFRHDHNTARNS